MAGPTAEPLRILSLSGGGIRGILQAVLLTRLEADLGTPLNRHFDLIAGTSTGGIVALAIAAGIPVREMGALYQHHGPRIFAPRPEDGVRQGPRYPQKPLADALTTTFGDARLGDLGVETVVTGSNLETLSGRTFSSSFDPGMLVRDAALATSAAPTYFPAVTPSDSQLSYMDGALWANDPSLVAVLHAQERMGAAVEKVRLFSVGTGRQQGGTTLQKVNAMRTASLDMVHLLLDFLMSAQASFSESYTGRLLPPGAYLQVNPQLPAPMALDDFGNAVQILPALAERHYEHHREQILAFVEH